jgi:hypothetical protein
MTGNKEAKHSHGHRRLQQAADYVSRQWFPLNPKITSLIQTKLKDGSYASNHQKLFTDLKQDFALLAHCLKKIKENNLTNSATPLEGFFTADFEALKEILSQSPQEISKHEFAGAEKGQALRLKYTVLSCSTAELMATAKKTNHDLAFTCALLRQLGLNLIAWNYPSIYTRALGMVKSAQSTLEELIHENLGFEPSHLAEELILSKETNPLIREAVGLGKSGLDQSALLNCGIDPGLVDICEIGEAFAQLNDPEHYPNISRNYSTVITQIDETLGKNGAGLIMNLVNNKFVTYVSSVPDVFRQESGIEQSISKVALDYTNKLFEQNAYAQRCPNPLKKELREVYKHVAKGQVSSIGVGFLVNKVIPLAGFTLGCVYLLDNKTNTLVPKLRIGQCNLSRYKPINCSLISPEGSLIVEAMYCSMPIKQEGVFLHGDLVSPILGPIGTKEPSGVLYIEMSESLQLKQTGDCLTYFKAIRDCLNDCLNL